MEETIHWLEYFKAFSRPILTTILFFLGYWFGYKKWWKQKQKETVHGIETARYQAKLDSCKAVWSLLAYMSEKENDKTVFVTREENGKRVWKLRTKPARDFLIDLPKLFFEQGHGIFMPPVIKSDIYNFRSMIYRFLESSKRDGETESEIIVKNNKMIEGLNSIRTNLADTLRDIINTNPN